MSFTRGLFRDFCVKNDVPELAGDAVADLTKFIVVLHMVDLQLPEVLQAWRSVVEVVVDHIVDDVTHVEANEEGRVLMRCHEEREGPLKGQLANNIARDRREHQSVPVRGERVMDAVDEEVGGEQLAAVRHVVHPVVLAMEEESVQRVLPEGPE